MAATGSAAVRCAGCGAALPPSRWPRARKWCSESCRKNTLYGGVCVDCGGPTSYDGRHGASERCAACAAVFAATPQQRILRCQTAAAAAVRWPDAYLLDCLRRAHEHLGGRLSFGRYRALEREQPFEEPLAAAATITHRFGSWNEALLAAGLPLNTPPRRSYDRTSAEQCVAAVRSVAGDLGHVPSSREYERLARVRRLPSLSLVQIRCGSWSAVLRALTDGGGGSCGVR